MVEESGPKTSSAALDVKLAIPAMGAYSWLSSGSFRRISSAYDRRGVSLNSKTRVFDRSRGGGAIGASCDACLHEKDPDGALQKGDPMTGKSQSWKGLR